MKKEDCIFCKIANGEIPSKTLYEDGDFRVILDLGPATRGHALILPREHADNLYELPEDTAAKVFVVPYYLIRIWWLREPERILTWKELCIYQKR